MAWSQEGCRQNARTHLSGKRGNTDMLLLLLLLLLPDSLLHTRGTSAEASVVPFGNDTDREALLAFKAGLDRYSGELASWNLTTDFCRWPGVTCSLRHPQRVSALKVSSSGLLGAVSPSLGNLTFLRNLDLSSNALYGDIPSPISYLRRLQYLDLSNNSFQGGITTGLHNCTSLVHLDIASNWLTGEIPAWLGDLTRLEFLDLQRNNLTGAIPPSVANLSSLLQIYLTGNHLEGAIPDGLGFLGRLEFLALPGNHLSGTIPASLFNLTSLTHFSVTQNELHGSLPPDLGDNLPKLQYLLLGMNHFTGGVPASLRNATMIYSLDLSFNNLTGSLPPELGELCPDFLSLDTNQLEARDARGWEFVSFLRNCTRLRILDLQDNRLGSVLPSAIGNLSMQLQVLYVGFNEISGTVPPGIGNLAGLLQLQLSSNRLRGVLPDSIGKLQRLQVLGFDKNRFSGSMPASLGNLTQLSNLFSDNNGFKGPLPTSLGNLQLLTVATFSNNEFTGPLPRQIFNLSSLSYALDLSGNHFVGSLPPEVGGLTRLTYLYVSSNNFSGGLPDTISNCQSLMYLRLDSNFFSGSIPPSLSKMQGLVLLNLTKNSFSGAIPQELSRINGLKELYLAHNDLSGQIPETLESMSSLYLLDISFNRLNGQVPSHGVFVNITGFSLVGNDGLCGGVRELHLPACPAEPTRRSRRTYQLIFKVVIPIASIIFCLILLLLAFLFLSLRRRSRARAAANTLPSIDDKYPRVSYAELLQATGGFATSNLVGTGRYGTVYRGTLPLNGTVTTVAVKVFNLHQSGSSKSFIAECEALSTIRHRNLISIITCCSSSDREQNDFKALVYEFIANQSLDRWLHPEAHAPPGLTMMQRLHIAVHVADALDYLHNSCQTPIVHCDLKPANVLLDADMTARVGDFGLAKVLPCAGQSEQLINSRSSIGIRGTIGYVAPEYGEAGQVSPWGDVYSFGIVLLEMLTGKAPTHDMFRDGLSLHKYVELAFLERLLQIADPDLLPLEQNHNGGLQGESNALRNISTCLLSVARVGLLCANQLPSERMCMRDVAAEMHKIREVYAEGNMSQGMVV